MTATDVPIPASGELPLLSAEGCSSYLPACMASGSCAVCPDPLAGMGHRGHIVRGTTERRPIFCYFFLLDQLCRAGCCCLVAQGLQPAQGETLVAVVRRGNEAGTTAAVIYVHLPRCGTKPLMILALLSAQRHATCVLGQPGLEQGLHTTVAACGTSCLPTSAGSLLGEGEQLWWAGCCSRGRGLHHPGPQSAWPPSRLDSSLVQARRSLQVEELDNEYR